MNNKHTEMLGKMDVKKALIKLSIPATIGMLVNALYNLVDSLFVGWGAGEIAIGALTLAFPVQMIVMAAALGVGIGSASVFSRAYGRNNKEAMHNTVNTAVRFGLLLAILISVLGQIFLDDLLLFFGASDSNIGFARSYLSIILIAVPFQSLSMILNNLTRAEGRAKVAMQAMVLGTGLNLILDPIFIFDWGLGLGVSGAAIATAISQFSAFSFIFYKTFAKESLLDIVFTKFFDVSKQELKEIIMIGLPTFFRNSVGAFLAIAILNFIKFYMGDDAAIYQSMYGVSNRVMMFVFMPGFGLIQGLAPIAGYNFGAKNWERLKEVIIFATKILSVYFAIGFILMQLGAPFIFDVFSKTNDQVFITEGSRLFRLMTAGLFLITFQILASAVYQSFGYAKRAMFISLSRQLIFFIPIALIFTNIWQLDGLWYTFAVSDIISGTIGAFMLIYEIRVLGKMMTKKTA